MAITTPEELLKVLISIQENNSDKKPEDYRYVIYARKSTNESEGKQIRSLGDQVIECREYAEKNNLIVVGVPIQEAESAKEPDIRPKFRAMLQDIKAGKYDGILSWHPDRLARNMKDAGEVIDLIDKDIIKNLKFVSFSFDNTTSGKMLLGITFVLSKEYSDKLSDNVHRGNDRSLGEGKLINRPKHGYYKDPNQLLRPDNENNNFLLIKNVFQMRLDGKIMKEIAAYLNENNYSRAQKDGSRKIIKMDVQGVEKILKDTFYTGILMYGKNRINLTTKYDFIPAVSVEDFMRINKVKKLSGVIELARRAVRKDNIKANLMRGMIICEECGESMSAGITPKKNKDEVTKYFYYRCDTDFCKRKGKSVRANVIMNYIYAFLDTKPFSSKASYDHYTEEMKQVSEKRSHETSKTIMALQAQKRDKEKKFLQIKDLLLKDEDKSLSTHYKGDLDKLEKEIKDLKVRIDELRVFMSTIKTSLLTYENFLELMDNMKQTMNQMKTMNEIDYLCRKIYMNFTISGKKVINANLSSPFAELYAAKISQGGR